MSNKENTGFLPKDYKVPTAEGGYMDLKQGDNKFRILSPAVIGWEYWNTDNKPVRSKEGWKTAPKDIKLDDKTGKPSRISHFWAFVVWNYGEEKIQILQLRQKTIMSQIKAYIDNPKWGDPKEYDININRTGEGFETEYTTTVDPKAPLEEEILDNYENAEINLDALYDGSNPFEGSKSDDDNEEDNEVDLESIAMDA